MNFRKRNKKTLVKISPWLTVTDREKRLTVTDREKAGWQLQTERKRLTVTDREKAVWQLQTERKRLTVTDREKQVDSYRQRKRCSYRCSVVCLLWNCLRMAVGHREVGHRRACVCCVCPAMDGCVCVFEWCVSWHVGVREWMCVCIHARMVLLNSDCWDVLPAMKPLLELRLKPTERHIHLLTRCCVHMYILKCIYTTYLLLHPGTFLCLSVTVHQRSLHPSFCVNLCGMGFVGWRGAPLLYQMHASE